MEIIFLDVVSLLSAAAIGAFFPTHWLKVGCGNFGGADFFSVEVDAFFSITAAVALDLVLGDCFVGNAFDFSITVDFRSDCLIGDFDSVLNGLDLAALALTTSATFC